LSQAVRSMKEWLYWLRDVDLPFAQDSALVRSLIGWLVFPVILPTYNAYKDGTDRVFRNVGVYNSDAGKSSKRNNTPFRTRRKYETKKRHKCVFQRRAVKAHQESLNRVPFGGKPWSWTVYILEVDRLLVQSQRPAVQPQSSCQEPAGQLQLLSPTLNWPVLEYGEDILHRPPEATRR
jgi:hypothetical protein